MFTFVGRMISDESAQTGKNTYDNFFTCWKSANGSGSGNNATYGACRWPNGQLEDNVLNTNCESAGGDFLG